MAIRQPYRGNPELKQYHLINDFSGGLDTTSLDEKMRDNEFREMKNIELALQGSISNRKGFGELKHFNQWLEDKSVTRETGKTTFFKILKSDKPVLKWANDYVDTTSGYTLFQSRMNSEIYELKILTATQSSTDVKFDLLTVQNTDGTSGGASASISTVLTLTGATLKDKLNIKTHQYVQKIYFLSYDVYTTSTTTDKGILVYNLDNDTLTILKSTDTYTPTPFEVESFGFNVLRDDPLADVADQGFGDFAITGTYLTDTNDNYIEKIPTSGNFNINAFQIGATMEPRDVTLVIKNQSGTVLIGYDLGTVTDEGGFFKFPITNFTITNNVTSVTFEFKPKALNAEDAILITVPIDLSHIVNDTDYVAITSDRTVAYQYTGTGSKYAEASYTEKTVTVFPNSTVMNGLLSQSNLSEGDITFTEDDEHYHIVGAGVTSTSTLNMALSFTTKEQLFLQTNTLYKTKTILPNSTIRTTFYEYLGTTNYNATDFEIQTLNEFLEFETTYYIGEYEQSDVGIETLDLDGARMTQIQDRLVFYKGNSIYFSEQFQYDYVPNLNYVLLPINSTDEITHINFFRGSYIIFTKESIWRMSGTIFGSDFLVVKVNDFIGCIAPDSVRAVNNNLLFLSRQGLYALTQSYYQEGLENVKKIDERISDIIPFDENAYGVMYQEQYWLLLPEATYDTLKYYFNSPKPNGGHPFTTDTYKVHPDNLEVFNGVIYSIKNGNYYRFDKDYTDFLPRNSASSVIPDYLYTYRFVTKNDDFRYPTHDKKVKSVYFKIRSDVNLSMGVTIFRNELSIIDPNTYTASTNEYGEVIYNYTTTPNLTRNMSDTLGNFELGEASLGGTGVVVHKFLIGKKGKNFSIAIEQKTNGAFNIEDIGYLFKLGKVKESR